jgi:predicted ATPase
VKWYNSQIYSKLGVSNRDSAIKQATALGLLTTTSTPPEQTVPNNLPVQTTPFIGRQRELGTIDRLCADPDVRLVTILAPGGMGKTRLALASAAQQLRRFSDGVFFVPLAPLRAPDDIVMAIADSVSFDFYGSDPPIQQLLSYLRQCDLLLVLDNFEHLLEGAHLVTDILHAAPSVKILITSREKLNLAGETVYMLSGLHFPDWETPEDALEYDAVKLFMQRARLARPDFELQVQNLNYLARICRLTAGMPLGIVLAAGWLDVMSLERIAEEIQHGIDILETEQRDVPERQRSVRATFNYSWTRLSQSEQYVFMRLSLFRGGFTPEAAEAVAGADMRLLRRLVSKALVQALPEDRYDIHELLRQYTEGKLGETGEADEVRQAHGSYYMDFMADRDEDIKGRRQRAGLQEIRLDFENVKQAWLWAGERRHYDAISRALDCLVNFAEMNFAALETLAILQTTITMLSLAIEVPPHPVWDQAVVRRERVNYLCSLPINSELLEAILQHVRDRGDAHEIAYCLWVLGDHAQDAQDHLAAQVYYEECLALRQSLGDAFYTAHIFMGLAGVYRRRKSDIGRDCLRQCIRLRRAIGDHNSLGGSLCALADDFCNIGAFSEAEALIEEVLMIQAEIGKTTAYLGAMIVKAKQAFLRGDLDTAVHYIRAGQDFAGGRTYIGLGLINLALSSWIASVTGDYQRGYDLCQQVTSSPRQDWHAAPLNWALALAHCGLGNQKAAGQALAETLYLARDHLRAPVYLHICLPVAALLAAKTGDAQRAVALLALAVTIPEEQMGWVEQWSLLTEVRRDLEAELGADAFTSAIERGQQLELDVVVAELLAEYGGEGR